MCSVVLPLLSSLQPVIALTNLVNEVNRRCQRCLVALVPGFCRLLINNVGVADIVRGVWSLWFRVCCLLINKVVVVDAP